MNSSSCQLVPFASLALAFTLLIAPDRAAACSRAAPPPTLVGQPANGDRAVPTNAVLYYQLPANTTDIPGDYKLHTEAGELVALEVTLAPTHSQYVELKPSGALRPNTRYRLDAQWQMLGKVSYAWLTFETGAGPLEQRPDAPRAVLHTYQMGRVTGSTCGPMTTGTCVSVADDDAYIEYSLIDALGQMQPPVLARGSLMLLPLGARSTGSRCVELRVRGADGSRSEPLQLCGEEAPDADLSMLVSDPQVRCSSNGLQWCDTSGHRGIAPGVDAPKALPDLDCGGPRPGAQKVQAQQAHATAGGPSAPGEHVPASENDGGCSALPGHTPNTPGLTTFAMLSYFLRRRRRS